MKTSVVITTIFEPSKAVEIIAERDDLELIVVGDNKTPKDWSWPSVEYISVESQSNLGFDLSEKLPFNHYCRKMIGYLVAAKNGAEIIVDTDDDNLPKPGWAFPEFEGEFKKPNNVSGYVNIYQWFTDQHIWPRGLPLELITKKFDLQSAASVQAGKVGIWQGLADDDPDVDAIYRLTSNQPCFFNDADPVVLPEGTICPFNSQNTAFRKELFALLYLPTTVTFRFTDILRGLVAQPIMWQAGYELGFTNATVVQERNPHDLMRDFNSEIPMFQRGHDVIDIVSQAISNEASVETNLYRAYVALRDAQIVEDPELKTLEAWLGDLAALTGPK